MDPFNSNAQSPITKPMANNQTPQGDPVHGHKKRVLQSLMHAALGTPGSGRGIHDTVHGIKTALGAYKNYAKEWDGLHGVAPQTGAAGGGMAQAPAPMQKPPAAPNLQMPQNQTPTPPIQQQMAQPPAMPKQPMPPQAQPQQPMIQRPMPAFMGGGNPAGF